ncbi:hypothetical protein H2203_006645 [Taxawa tesnikishii (nom. ined.)]|nr:hypothetical protein H2203_006645 [Dothideales sp. JES 119]
MSKLLTGLLFAYAANAGPIPQASSTASALSCVGNTSNGTTYQAGTASYTILCGVDYAGGDMGVVTTSTFEQCIQTCHSATGCVDVSYVAGQCYLKNTLTTPVPNANVWTAVFSTAIPKPAYCINNSGNDTTIIAYDEQFHLLCNTDFPGVGDMGSTSASDFQSCLLACVDKAGCVAVSFTVNNCYLKRAVGRSASTSSVQSAVMPKAFSQIAAAQAALTCDNNASNGTTHIAANGGTYNIGCGIDYAGGDMSSMQTSSFSACIDACDSTSGCVDVSYVAPVCYLKSALNPGVAISYVWSATKTVSSSSGSSSSTPSSSSSTGATINILSAYYADSNVTALARAAFLQSGTLVIDTSNLDSLFGNPWSGVTKTLSILYSITTTTTTSSSSSSSSGPITTTYTFVAAQNTGVYTINTASQPASSPVPGYSSQSGSFTIIDVTWGASEIDDESIWDEMYAEAQDGDRISFSNGFFGEDSLPGQPNVGIIWFQQGGVLRALVGREGSSAKFPM